jgi:hypothetical protein
MPVEPSKGARRWVPLALVVALIAALTGAGTFVALARRGSSYPSEWDPRVAGLVSFVERERGLDFEHPVEVEFLDNAAFNERVTTDESSLTTEDREELDNVVSFLRAIGLVEGRVNLVDALNQASSEGILAFYDPKDEQITVRGTNLDVATRVTVVHELTHALQDQHFDIEKMRERADESDPITALLEGDANNIEDEYVDSLSPRGKRQYEAQSDRASDDADFEGIPPVIRIFIGAPYEFGPAFVEALRAEGGQAALDRAFHQPPTSEEHIFDPTTFIDFDDPETVDAPRVPEGAKKLDDGEFEPLGWYVMLSEQIDAHVALRATDGWGGDSYVAYRTRDDETCTRVRYQGERPRDTREMKTALDQWVAAVAGNRASVRSEGRTLLFESCDPGEKAKVATGNSLDAINLPVARVSIVQEFLSEGAQLDFASCVANRLVYVTSVQDLTDPDSAAFTSEAGRQRILAIATDCRTQTS